MIRKSNHLNKVDAQNILLLYFKSAKFLYLAVSYAESNNFHSVVIWSKIVSFCLDPINSSPKNLRNVATFTFQKARCADGRQIIKFL